MWREKDDLIPFEKSKKVIYLDRRGRAKRGIPLGAIFFWILGVCCILYCVCIAVIGFGTFFFLVWGVIGLVSLLFGAFLSNRERVGRLPRWLRAAGWLLFAAGFGLLLVVEGLIFSEYNAVPEPGADYLIVLGAQWKPEGPSDVLRRRLDRAIQYLRENPDTVVIASGGQGNDEPISEAEGMRQYLVAAGISDERILMEATSSTTLENLMFSGRLLDREKDRVVIVTNNFHMFRALRLARKQGYRHVEGLAASASTGMVPNNLLREFMGIVLQFVLGQL